MIKNIKHIRIAYEMFNVILVLIAVTFAFLDLIGKISIIESSKLLIIENSILAIFTIDYITRLYLSQNRKSYIKNHVFDLIAIIPFSSLFRTFKFVSIIRFFQMSEMVQVIKLLRLFAFLNKLRWKMSVFLKTNGFIYIILVTVATIFLGAVGIFYAEHNHSVNDFEDALWWSIVTATTVGYGDIAPVTSLGRIIACILMALGTTFMGIYIGTITTYFINKKKEPVSFETNKIDVSHLKNDEIEEVIKYIDYIVNKR